MDAFCAAQEDGNYPDFLVSSPLCAPSYIACAGGKGAVLADLDIIATPNGAWVPAVFQNLSTVANVSDRAVPGAIGTIGCNCTALYEDPESAVACAVCGLIQDAGFCTPEATDDLSSFSCQAPYPGNTSLFVNCGIGGESWVLVTHLGLSAGAGGYQCCAAAGVSMV